MWRKVLNAGFLIELQLRYLLGIGNLKLCIDWGVPIEAIYCYFELYHSKEKAKMIST